MGAGGTSNTLAHRMGTGRRVTGLAAAAVVTTALIAGTAPLSYVPTPIVGGVLAFMGLAFLFEWLVGGYRTLPPLEYAIVVLIVLVIAIAGLVPGIAAGMLLALSLFVISYGRVDPVKHVLTGTEARSRSWRRWTRPSSAPSGERLFDDGARNDAIYIVATGQVTARLAGPDTTGVRLQTLRGGHIVGAVGFHTGAERTQSVVADEPTMLYRLTRDGLAALTARDPALAATFHRLVVRDMAGQLAHLTRLVEALQR